MTRTLKIIFGLCSLLLSGLSAMFYLVGNHGHLMFRPHMTEDWIIWGVALSTALLGIYLLTNLNKSKS